MRKEKKIGERVWPEGHEWTFAGRKRSRFWAGPCMAGLTCPGDGVWEGQFRAPITQL